MSSDFFLEYEYSYNAEQHHGSKMISNLEESNNK